MLSASWSSAPATAAADKTYYTIIIMLWGAVVLVFGMVIMGQVMTTKTVKAERVVETMTDSVTRGMGVVVEVDQTWHMTEEFKAIMGREKLLALLI